jgi:thioredoxin 2
MATVDLSEQNFESTILEGGIVLVDFWAAWCGPCKMAKPEVAKVAKEMAGRALVLEVDTEKHPQLAAQYRVQGIPHFVVLRNGALVFQQAGLVRAAEMKRWLEQAGASTAAKPAA